MKIKYAIPTPYGTETRTSHREYTHVVVAGSLKAAEITRLHAETVTALQNRLVEYKAELAKGLSMQRQKRKILMVFSDGQPATGDTSFQLLQADLRTRIAEITKFGIEVIGVGIETEYVKEFYPDYVILKNAKDLPKQAMNKISKLLQAGL